MEAAGGLNLTSIVAVDVNSKQGPIGCARRHLSLSFSYVCPEPVLAKGCILYINCSKMAFFRRGFKLSGSPFKGAYEGKRSFFPMNFNRRFVKTDPGPPQGNESKSKDKCFLLPRVRRRRDLLPRRHNGGHPGRAAEQDRNRLCPQQNACQCRGRRWKDDAWAGALPALP
jgi:hypothetical protein